MTDSNSDHSMATLAWQLRSSPKWKRIDIIWDFAMSRIKRPVPCKRCAEKAIKFLDEVQSTAEILNETFDENSEKWRDSNVVPRRGAKA